MGFSNSGREKNLSCATLSMSLSFACGTRPVEDVKTSKDVGLSLPRYRFIDSFRFSISHSDCDITFVTEMYSGEGDRSRGHASRSSPREWRFRVDDILFSRCFSRGVCFFTHSRYPFIQITHSFGLLTCVSRRPMIENGSDVTSFTAVRLNSLRLIMLFNAFPFFSLVAVSPFLRLAGDGARVNANFSRLLARTNQTDRRNSEEFDLGESARDVPIGSI